MKTNARLLASLVVVVVVWAGASAGTTATVVKRGEASFAFGDWSAPEPVVVPSSGGSAQLVRRVCGVDERHPMWSKARELHLLLDPSTREVWLGEPAQRYLLLEGKIWGIRLTGNRLEIRRSEAAGPEPKGEEMLIEEFLTRFVEEPETALWAARWRFFVDRIFSPRAISASLEARRRQEIDLSAVSVDADSATLMMITQAGHTLTLRVGSAGEILAAECDGRPFPVLLDGSGNRETHGFNAIGNRHVICEGGTEEAFASIRNIIAIEESGQDRQLAIAAAVVLPRTGDFWIGPGDCTVALLEGRLLGLRVDGSQELQVFSESRPRLPLSPASIPVFRAEVTRFEREFQAARCLWQPDLRINIRNLFAPEADVPTDAVYWLGSRSVSVQEGLLRLQLECSQPRQCCELVLGPALEVRSARIIPRE